MLLGPAVVFAFSLTLLAGLSTGLGSLLGLWLGQGSSRLLALALSFSAGVLLYVSFVEIFAKARASLSPLLGPGQGYALSVLAFFGGIALIALVDHWLPVHALLPTTLENSRTTPPTEDRRLWRLGLVSAIAIAIHNFPEGLATFLGGLSNPRLGISIAIAIAIHNIPEGLAIAAPVVAATGNRRMAFLLSFASGLAEPMGAAVGYLLLRYLYSPLLMGIVFAGVAGMMVYLCLDELLPAAQRIGSHRLTMAGVVGGMAVMALSLVLLA